MTERNLPSLRSIALDGAALTGLSIDALDALLSEADAENKIISAAKRAIVSHIEATYAAPIAGAYQAAGKDFGSVHVSDGAYDIIVDTPKKVEWSQEGLAAIEAAIRDSGDKPEEYIKVSRTVEERAYAAWPSHIRATFDDARTVRPGTRTVKLLRKEAA